jgi:hypothetical protein
MKLIILEKTIKLEPEDNEDMFMIGRISKNMKCKITKDNQHLEPKITGFEIPIPDTLNMLAEGVIEEVKDEY